MKSIKLFAIALAIAFFCVSACKDNEETLKNTQPKENAKILSDFLGKKQLKNFSGIVVDTNKKPLENVYITIENQSIMTDSFGSFVINDVTVFNDFTYLEGRKEGYKNTTIRVDSITDLNNITVKLISFDELCLFWFCEHNHSLSNLE